MSDSQSEAGFYYVTKWPAKGIVCVPREVARVSECGKYLTARSYLSWLRVARKDFHETWEEACDRYEEYRIRKVRSLEKRISRLQKARPKVVDWEDLG